jgi:hypothetical protein
MASAFECDFCKGLTKDVDTAYHRTLENEAGDCIEVHIVININSHKADICPKCVPEILKSLIGGKNAKRKSKT